MKRKVRLTYIQLCRYRRKTDFPTVSYLTHKIITHTAAFFDDLLAKRGQTIQCTSLRQKLNYPTHIFSQVTRYMNYNPFYNLALAFYLIWYVIIHSWWTVVPFLTSFSAGRLLNYLGTHEIKCTFWCHLVNHSFAIRTTSGDGEMDWIGRQ